MKSLSKIMSFLSLIFLVSCSNVFSDLSERTTNKAKLFQAKLLLDRSDWDGAIAAIESLSTSYQIRRDVRALLASAYAGRCGIDMLTLIDGISNGSAPRLLMQLVETMADATLTAVDDCILAETTLDSIGTAAERTVDENLLMTFVQFGKIGAILNVKADVDDNNQFDVTGDAAFDACDPADMPENDTPTDKASLDQLVASIAILVTSLQASGSEIAGDSLDDLLLACDGASGTFNICTATDSASVTADQRTTMTGIIREAESVGLGINTTVGPPYNVVSSACP
jgi:hypothetical protein